jgi:hypothetical protein
MLLLLQVMDASAQDDRDNVFTEVPVLIAHRVGEAYDFGFVFPATRSDLVSDGPRRGYCSKADNLMTITARWYNYGPAVEHWVDLFVSHDKAPVLGDVGDYRAYVLSPADSYNELLFTVAIPENWGVDDGNGNRRVDVIVDSLNFVGETYENNNTFGWTFNYWWGGACDP